jgi:hypothetical protein
MAKITATEVEKVLREKELDGIEEIYDYPQGYVTILIDGDWKHSHGYCDYLMGELGFELVREVEVGEDDGDDWYEAERTYKQK